MLRNQKLLRISTILFMVQSAAWCLFSFLCILCIENAIHAPIDFFYNYSTYLLFCIYQIFFNQTIQLDTFDLVVTPKVFESFAFIHMFLAISWFVLSAVVYARSSKRRIHSVQGSSLLISWLVNGYIVALVDAIFAILLMADLIETAKTRGVLDSQILMPAIGLVFTIVSRGVTLWIVNVSFIIMLSRRMYLSPRNHRNNESRCSNQYERNAYVNDAYQRNYQPPQQIQQQIISPAAMQQQNNPYRTAPVSPNYEPFHQGEPTYTVNTPRYQTPAPASPYAQINKNPAPGRQSPPKLHAIAPPQIPEPDYQMGPRTVLKNRSQYDDRY